VALKSRRTWFTFKRVLIILGSVFALLALLVLAFLYQPAYALDPKARSFIEDAISQQNKIEAGLQAYYQAGEYTFADPMVIQNPYQTAPLTALLVFDTPENSQISIHIPGKTPQAAVDYTFPGYLQHHEIPVYGLYADMLNHVTVSMKTQSGEEAQTQVDLQTEPLPVYMQVFQVDKVDPEGYGPGFNFSFSDQKPVFDLNGDVRWYSTRPSYMAFTKLKNGHYLFVYSIEDQENNPAMEEDLLGRIYAVYHFADGIHHDILELPSGNLLATTSELKSDTIQDILLEVNRANGHVVHTFNMKKILDADRPRILGNQSRDWLHLNSITYDPTDGTIIISANAQSAIIKLTYPGMQIKWILGSHDNWSEKYQPYLLTPVGETLEWPWSQHHATLYGPDIPGDGLVDILLFDNGQYRSFDLATAHSPLEWYSRVVHYRINEEAMTVEQVWEYGKENGAATFSGTLGSAFLLPNGDVLGTWGSIAKNPEGIPKITAGQNDTDDSRIIEIDPSNDQVSFDCTVKGSETYRTFRAGLYDDYSEDNPYLLTSLNDTSGNDLYDRAWMAWRDVKNWSDTFPPAIWLKRIGRRILSTMR
jgi:arylsulfate sulfotransferase